MAVLSETELRAWALHARERARPRDATSSSMPCVALDCSEMHEDNAVVTGKWTRRGAHARRAAALGAIVLWLVVPIVVAWTVLGAVGDERPPAARPLHPVTTPFVPNDAQLATCSDPDCFEQALGNVAFRAGAKAALELVPSIYGNGSSSGCHRGLHTIGAAALARNGGDVAKTLAEGSSICWSGYYHGVLEHSLLGVPRRTVASLAAVARPLCDGMEQMTPWLRYQCLHGLGHGLMITTGLHLPRSLDVCRRLETRWERSACKGGVFMENISSSYGLRSRWLRDDDPVYPCNAVARADKFRCYQMVTSRILPLVGDDWQRAAEVCSEVELSFVWVCFRSLGRDASSRSNRDPDAIIATCEIARVHGHDDECIAAAAMDMTANDTSPEGARSLCAKLSRRLVTSCYYGLGSVMAMFETSEDARRRACLRVVAAERLRAACVRGGLASVPRS
jgi:hypothetical protein